MNCLNLDDYREHKVSIVICIPCLHRWVAVRPSSTKLVAMECPACKCVGGVIETGQEILDD